VLALERALQNDKRIYLATQRDASQDNPTPKDIFGVGTVASIVRALSCPMGTSRCWSKGCVEPVP